LRRVGLNSAQANFYPGGAVIETGEERSFLLCRMGSVIGALALEHVRETLRPLPIAPLAGVPVFVLGCAILRGDPVPVIDACRLLGQEGSGAPARFVSLRLEGRAAVLAVDAVLDVRPLPREVLAQVPALLRGSDADLVRAIGAVDSSLLVMLESARLVPEEAFASIERERSAARGGPG
jgi:purine-binding chemotaxis protein CheW